MKKRLVTFLVAAGCGALIGALATLLRGQGITANPAFSLDRAVLAHRGLLAAAFACWVLFSLYWEAAAKNAAQSATSESRVSRGFHVGLTNIALLLELPFVGLGRFMPASVAIMSLGLAIEFCGLLLTFWARHHLGRNWSGEISIKVDHELIRSGPYRMLRHPIYTGLLTMYAGVMLVTGEKLAIFGFILALFAYWRKIRLEEKNLQVAFGPEYDDYRRESWALVPGLF